ncbi:(2Fe-2S)-binding protein [Marinobacterium arenosum]|uniref:(2Fe-2S)-binding protein n=1 Tax=Marinobacterium arenosum TaxID=2862496 RepID=UPI0036F2288E
MLWLDDPAGGRFRAAGLKEGRLQWLLLVLPYQQFPDPGWLDLRFAERTLEPAARRQLLSASAADKPDCGAIVCSCFQVGERQIADAMAAGIDSVEALGSRLKCGSNCGSCIPELKALLRKAG